MARRTPLIRPSAWIAAGLLALTAGYWLVTVGTPSGAVPRAPDWFADAYDLQEGEVARFVPPPYPPLRQQHLNRGWAGGKAPASVTGQLLFHAGRSTGGAQPWNWGMSSAAGTLQSAIDWAGMTTMPERDIPDSLKSIAVDGDWIIRPDAPREQRMAAIESILRQHLQRNITIRRRMVPAEVIVVSGAYQFKSLGRGRRPETVQLFTDDLDPVEGAGGGSGRFKQLLERIEDLSGLRAIDQTDSAPSDVSWSNNRSARLPQDKAGLSLLLQNLSAQTSLTFRREMRDVEVWFVRDSDEKEQSR